MLDADSGEEPEGYWVSSVGRLRLDNIVEQLPKLIITGPHRHEGFGRDIDELHGRRVCRLRQWIDLRPVLGQLHGRFQVTRFVGKCAPRQKHLI